MSTMPGDLTGDPTFRLELQCVNYSSCAKADEAESLSRDNFFLFSQYFLYEINLLNFFLLKWISVTP